LSGLSINQARKTVVAMLAEEGSAVTGDGPALAGEPRPLEHPVKFYERGERPLEFVPTRQWFVRVLDHRADLLEQGRRIAWHPANMRVRYENWVEGLNQDWCISRQRYFGVPFPVWYPLGADGQPEYDHPIFADGATLPVDPLSDAPPGFAEAQRGQPGGFMGDPDVMDTWATSSLTPQIVSGWPDDPERHHKLFPMDIRPQAHEIIRTWAFYTIVKAWMHHREIPWKHVCISGWILDPDRKKMSKSQGNVVTPDHLLEQYSSDAVRYWAARARLGVDTKYEENVFKVGGRLCTKIFNASRFVLGALDRTGQAYHTWPVEAICEPLDCAYVARLRALVGTVAGCYDQFDYAGALQASEEAFWEFCDDFVELVKRRAYSEDDGPARRSALATLHLALRLFLRLLAPVLPFVTEEVWSWRFAGEGRDQSVHTSPRPAVDEMAVIPQAAQAAIFDCAVEVLRKIRAAKTGGKRSLRWPVVSLALTGSPSDRSVPPTRSAGGREPRRSETASTFA